MNTSRTRRIPALVLTALVLVTVLAACGTPRGETAGGTPSAGSENETPVAPYPELEVGDCTTLEDAEGILSIKVVPCDQPHTEEIFHRIDLPDGPFDSAVIEQATQECLGQAFTDFIGVPRDQSALLVVPVSPTAEQWDAGARTMYCGVFDEADVRSGSLEGSTR